MSTPHRPRAPPQYHPRLLELLAAPTPLAELSYLIGASIVDLLPLAAPSAPPSPPSESTSAAPSFPLPPIEEYIWEVAGRARQPTGVLLAVLVYINRLKKLIPPSARGRLPCTHLRIFYGSFSLACKYLWDSKYDLARASLLFDPPSVARIERELLSLFDYRVEISAEELTAQALVLLHVYPDILLRRSPIDGPELPLPSAKRRKTNARLTHKRSPQLASPINMSAEQVSAWSDSSDGSPLGSPNPAHATSPSPPPPNDPFPLEPTSTPYNTAISSFSDLDIFHTPRSSSTSPIPLLTPPPSKRSRCSPESPLQSPPSSPPSLGTPSPFSDEEATYRGDDEGSESWTAVGKGTIWRMKRKRDDDD